MGLYIRKFLAFVFQCRLTMVTDFDGEVNFRLATKIGKKWIVRRMGLGIGTVLLAEDGQILSKPCYVSAVEFI